jgi:hypothetical protein
MNLKNKKLLIYEIEGNTLIPKVRPQRF